MATNNKIEQEIEQKMELIHKIVDQLVFKRLNIPYEIDVEYSGYMSKYYFVFNVDVDVDRYLSFTRSHDVNYEKFMDNLHENIISSLRYVNLQSEFGGITFHLDNDDETHSIMYRLNEDLHKKLQKEYNKPFVNMENSGILYNLEQVGDNHLHFTVEFIGDARNPYGATCNELEKIMSEVYNKSKIDLHPIPLVCF